MSPFGFETRLLAQASAALVDAPVDPSRAHVVLADFLRRAPRTVALGLRLLIWLTPLLPFLLAGRIRLFGRLTNPERAVLWSRALSHRFWAVRQLATGYKAVACLCVFDFDAVGMS